MQDCGWNPSLSRRQLVRAAGAASALLLAPAGSAWARAARPGGPASASNRAGDSVVLQWNDAALEAVRASRLGPPMVSRALAVVHTSIFDAWAAYHHKAVGTRLGSSLRRPAKEWTLENKSRALSFAAYRSAVDLFPGSKATVFDPLMAALGYDAGDVSTDVTTSTGVGNVAAQAVLDFRHADRSNQLGNTPGGTAGAAYSDYTGYKPANAPMDTRVPLDPTTVSDPSRWQPLTYVDATGATVTPGFIAPHWLNVTPFALGSAAQFRSSTGPAAFGSPEYVRQAEELVAISAGLTDEQKVIAEYWADGPRSELPPGHWNLFAQFVSRRDGHGAGEHGVDADVKLFFALTNAVFDAGICAWDNKRAFDSVRPITAVRHLFNVTPITAWGGPGRGTRTIDGGAWLPYQPTTFPTPPFGEYSSGHSNFSAAGSEVLRQFTNHDGFGASVTIPAWSSRIEPGVVPAADVTLRWDTFTDAANEAGISRQYGGIHFEQGDLDARATGRSAAKRCWDRAVSYWEAK